MNFGFIYLRDNNWWNKENVIKMGITTFAKDRNNTYITSEIERGEYICLIQIPLDKMKILDKFLKTYFKSYHIYKGGGTEFYDRCIIELVEPYLNDINITFKTLTKEEINSINRCERIKNLPNADKVKILLNKINVKNIILRYKNKRAKIKSTNIIPIIPNNHQQDVLNIIEEYFQLNNIGKIIWACGLGKALLSILIVKQLRYKIVAFGVPGKYLQKQITNEILKLFPKTNNILFVGGKGIYDIDATTDKNKIVEFLKNNDEPKFIITTYSSCNLLCDSNIIFDIKIGDEAHHLVGLEKEDNKGFRKFHKINSNKTLFMTATEKVIETQINKITSYSMNDESIFGKYIDKKSVYWAIENNKITDYNILVLKNTETEVKNIISSLNNLNLHNINEELFISCYMTLKSMYKYNDLTHILLYTTTIDDSEQASKYIEAILSTNIIGIPCEHIYYSSLHSKSNSEFDNEITKFKNSLFGIISCVNCFGEGVDIPRLNGVCVASNMHSEIRIVQYLLRPNRLDSNNPNKKAYIIIPYIEGNENNWNNNNSSCSYSNIRTIISHLRNVDNNVEQKILVQTVNKQTIKYDENLVCATQLYEDYKFEGNIEELNNLKIRLRYSKSLCSDFTEEQDEYNYIRSLNMSLHLDSKEEYAKCKDRHLNFIDNAEEYFKYKGVWKDWYHFLGTDTSMFIQSKQLWIEFCKNKNIKNYEEYIINCNIYKELPKNPGDFYIDFTNFNNELGVIIRRR
jgi:superfamily II DNA or RNA helicase